MPKTPRSVPAMASELRALRLTPPSERNDERRGRWLTFDMAGGRGRCSCGAFGGVEYALDFPACPPLLSTRWVGRWIDSTEAGLYAKGVRPRVRGLGDAGSATSYTHVCMGDHG